MKHLLILILTLAATLQVMAQEQKRYVTGTVTDEKGEPVIGATIRTENGKSSTVTDIDGKFSIAVAPGEVTLVAEYFGYMPKTTVVKPSIKTLILSMLPDNKTLDEVVVVGYGTQKKSALTSSVEVIKSEDLLRVPAMNIDEQLGGQVAGMGVMVQTGDPSSNKEADIRIRGINGAPLLVIDGVPRFGTNTTDGETRLSDLNPDDIESISILKDAAASAVYGARAANGVILVQTKRGKDEGRVRVNYRGQANLQEATYLPKFLNAYQFAELYNRAVDASGSDVYTKYDLSKLGSNPNLYGDEDMLDYLNKYGYSTRHSISVSGGSKFVKFLISGGYASTQGLYSSVGRDRYNYAVKLDANIIKGLTFSVDINGTISSNQNSSYSTLDAAYSYSPLQVLRYTDGNLASISGSNPLVAIEGLGGYNKYKTNYLTLSGTLRYEIPKIDGLSVYLKGTMDMNKAVTTKFSKPVALYLYDELTNTTSIDSKTVYPNAKITMSQLDQHIDNKLIEFGVNYNHTFAEKHNVGATAVFNYQDYRNNSLQATNNNMPGEYPEILGTATDSKVTGKETYSERASAIGRVNYGFDNRYFAEFSFRVDGSTKFAPKNRWGFFPTVSASWVISNEPFFKKWHQPVISQAKLRASTGWLGDDGSVGDYAYLMNYMFSTNAGYNIGGIFSPGIMISTGDYPNENLKWGKSHDYNLAADLGFWDNRFQATFEYYWRYRTNMITTAPSYLYPPSTGTDGVVPSLNFGKVKAWGWDFSISHINTVGKVKYNVTFNIAKTQDKVLDYGDESSVSETQRRVGHSSMVWSVYEAAGLFQSYEEIENWSVDQDGQGNGTLAPGDIKYLDQDGNGVLTEADKIYVKNSSYPDITYGLSLGVQYRGFRFNALFQGAAGYNQKLKELYTLESNSLQRFQDYHYTNTWTEDNPNAEYPRIKFASKNDNNRLESTYWIRKCNYLRLKSLSLGYSVPKEVLSKAHISSLDINLTAGNLFTLSSLDNMDPESLRGYPLSRSYGLSLNFGF